MFLNNICLKKIRIWEVFCSLFFANLGCSSIFLPSLFEGKKHNLIGLSVASCALVSFSV